MDAPLKPERSFLARIFISPDEVRLRAGWRLVGQTALLVLLVALFSCPFILWYGQNSSSEVLFLVDKVLGIFAITGSVFLARRVFDQRSIPSLGLEFRAQAFVDALAGILIAGLMMGFVYALEWGLGWLKFEHFAWQAQPLPQVALDVLIWLGVFLLVGWQEELLARGYWLQNLIEGLNLFWGVLISSILFALGHLINPNFSWNAFLGLILAGVFLAYGYLRTRQLWLPIGLHIGWNFFEGTVFGFQVSGLTEMPNLIQQTVQGPELVTGGMFGPEAGLVILPAMALGFVLVYGFTYQRRIKNHDAKTNL